MNRLLAALIVLGAGSVGACVGEITDPGSEGEGPGTGSAPLCNKGPVPGEAPIRRLSNAEYQNTITDLFGDEALATSASEGLSPETVSLGFHNGAKFLQVSEPVATGFLDAAEKIAASVAKNPAVFPCSPAGDDKACAIESINALGLKAYRRPLTSDEVSAYEALYDKGKAETGFESGMEWVIFTMLQSPYFLYRVEFGQDGADKKITRPGHYEMASRLSYLLWQSMPDAELFQAAADQKLGSKAEIAAQARRMLADPKAKRVRQFFEEWLDVDTASSMQRDSDVFPEWKPALGELFREETRAFVDHVLWDEGGDFMALLTAPYSFLNAELAQHYGVSGPKGSAFELVPMPGRAGVFTQAGVVTAHDRQTRTAIVTRGLKIRTDFLCQTIGSPPNDVIPVLKELSAQKTQKQRLEEHRANSACAACHDLTDPIGVVFESFDALGRSRSVDEFGVPVDTKSELGHTQDADGPVADATELASRLAQSEEVRQCFATQAFRFFYGRAEADEDTCSQKQLFTAFEKSSYSITELFVALTQTDAFLYRPTVVPEETP